jgi:hypothetical protein
MITDLADHDQLHDAKKMQQADFPQWQSSSGNDI